VSQIYESVQLFLEGAKTIELTETTKSMAEGAHVAKLIDRADGIDEKIKKMQQTLDLLERESYNLYGIIRK
jgi:hypothetical protein